MHAVRRSWPLYIGVFFVVAFATALIVDAVFTEDRRPWFDQTSEAAVDLGGVIDHAELCHRRETGGFTDDVRELERTMRRLAQRSVGARLSQALQDNDLALELHASKGGVYYTQRVRGDEIDQAVSRRALDFADYGSIRSADKCTVPR